MAAIKRSELLDRFEDMVRRRVPYVGGGAGTGLSAKGEMPGRDHDTARAVDVEDVADQCDYVRRRAGAAHVGIGSGLAEGIEQGVRSATRQRNRNGERDDLEWVAFVVGSLLKTMAVATEEADKRCWQTLPAQIQLARLWVPAGEYDLRIRSLAPQGGLAKPETTTRVTLHAGDTRFVVERILQ